MLTASYTRQGTLTRQNRASCVTTGSRSVGHTREPRCAPCWVSAPKVSLDRGRDRLWCRWNQDRAECNQVQGQAQDVILTAGMPAHTERAVVLPADPFHGDRALSSSLGVDRQVEGCR